MGSEELTEERYRTCLRGAYADIIHHLYHQYGSQFAASHFDSSCTFMSFYVRRSQVDESAFTTLTVKAIEAKWGVRIRVSIMRVHLHVFVSVEE